MRAVALALAILGLTAAAQIVVFVAPGSVALLSDLIHNVGDAATSVAERPRPSSCRQSSDKAQNLLSEGRRM